MATYETAEDQFVTVDGVQYAYRRVGPARGVPLVMLMHFRGTMDHWDPALINALAVQRPVLLLDNAGVGRSGGAIPKTFAGWADNVIAVALALGIAQADVMGFSMGGCAAQMVALRGRGLVRRLILAGTTPSIGPGVRQFQTKEELAAFVQLNAATTDEEHRTAFLASFFAPTPGSQAAGAEAWRRIQNGRPGRRRVPYVGPEGAKRQGIAFAKFMDPKQAADASFSRLEEIKIPVLIASGKQDLLLSEENNVLVYNKLSNAYLNFYPDSGHGFLYQYANEFATLINNFLDGPLRDGPERCHLLGLRLLKYRLHYTVNLGPLRRSVHMRAAPCSWSLTEG
ncbi:alpha/beta-hydrolase [Thozetella sp. PMI_491]|nr:alpha/beta-hydrolase [Thozetella sp. PMI_491]